jgi:hypothetical protein
VIIVDAKNIFEDLWLKRRKEGASNISTRR